jgi:hypothetical protein
MRALSAACALTSSLLCSALLLSIKQASKQVLTWALPSFKDALSRLPQTALSIYFHYYCCSRLEQGTYIHREPTATPTPTEGCGHGAERGGVTAGFYYG